MTNKKLYGVLSTFVITAIIASSVSGSVYAATGDIINTGNQKKYDITSSKDIQALILDLKDGGTDVFLKEGTDGKYYSPSDKLNLQSAEVAKLLKAANVNLKDATAIKTYIKNNAATIVAAIKVETDKVATQTVDTTSYTTSTVENLLSPILTAVSFEIEGTVAGIKDANGNFKVSLANKNDTDMLSAINLFVNEKSTMKITVKGMTRTITTNDSGEATILVSDLFGGNSQVTGISVGTIKNELTGDSGVITVAITDVARNEKMATITVTSN
ncbi:MULTISPECIES: hypothetical protein [Clostridium]|uniref:Uncharacterized protein n=1 Tax=Clostridium frigoriphilum TaxID=443253 RepID=A0ABU7USF0_9CLOT|nr:hypothetical protein [Clostridium sp. DSM 17811]MBU3101572.1 hypothetical protein [Clostridium sp. DSM 17811]